jgi:hypothetical protein
MAAKNRSSLIAKLQKVLKQHYKPITPSGPRQLLEHMLFACCLENSHYDRAEKTYQNLATSFFDWNEVRVSTVKELSEAMRDLPDPMAAASNLKRILQTVFESSYSFDLEAVKKQNLGAGIKRLGKLEGATPFVVAYGTQQGLEGHFIPLDRGALEVLYIVGIASEAERASGAVAGLERAIPKKQGAMFGSLLHQFAADFIANPFSPTVKNLLLSINSEAKDRLPKRGQKKPEPAPVLETVNHKGRHKGAVAEPPSAIAKETTKGRGAKHQGNGSEKPGKGAGKIAEEAHKGGKTPALKATSDAGKKSAIRKGDRSKSAATRKPVRPQLATAKGSSARRPSAQLTKRKPR